MDENGEDEHAFVDPIEGEENAEGGELLPAEGEEGADGTTPEGGEGGEGEVVPPAEGEEAKGKCCKLIDKHVFYILFSYNSK